MRFHTCLIFRIEWNRRPVLPNLWNDGNVVAAQRSLDRFAAIASRPPRTRFSRRVNNVCLQFNILLKSHLSTRGELVVTTGAEYQNYVGLKVAGRTQSTVRRTILPSTGPSTCTCTSSSSAQPTGPPTRNPITVSLADRGNAALLSIAVSIVGDQ
ncbi:unnamed protein product [Caenorhabditis sp. 36 PRJEB53466]|nr:unnamed protein product [Caenorhabditis sp. 36 PRJEB53466]